ncbi:MAG: BON domain-containing protein [Planctomycetota bacterium]
MRRFFVSLAMIATVLAPLGASADDRQIAEQIVRSLKQRKAAGDLQGFNIDLQVDKGAVWLKGYVSTPEQEQLAVDIARRAEGVEKVFNQIELRTEESDAAEAVTTSSRQNANPVQLLGDAPADSAQPVQATAQLASSEEEVDGGQEESRRIAQVLVAKLRDEQKAGNLERFGIDVQADKGTLRLKGQVATEEQRHTVLEIARRIPGVKQVVNELSIKSQESAAAPVVAQQAEEQLAPSTSRRQAEAKPIAAVEPQPIADSASQEITDEVLRRLAAQKKLGALRDFGIDVQAKQGVVWMSGYVADAEQATLALDMARYVPGVKQVVNDLSVTKAAEEATVQFVAHPGNHVDRSVPVEPQGLQPLRPAAAPQADLAPPAAPAQAAQAASQLPQGYSYLPTNQKSQVAGWALVNVGGDQSQTQPAQIQPAQIQPAQIQPAQIQQAQMQQAQMQQAQMQQMYQPVSNQMPMAFAPARPVNYTQMQASGQPAPMMGGHGVGVAPARYDHPQLPGYAWPSYAASPNYGAVSYPQQYSAQAWPYIGPFYPYPQVPLGWRKVTLEWDDGWWQLDFKDRH